jgi:hypothetical protein
MTQPWPESGPKPTREVAGPFLILGVDKDVDEATVDAHWAERVLWCRKGQTRLALEDVHWARELLRDPSRRPAADAASLNADLATGEVRRLARLYHIDGSPPGWEPLDPEPPIELPAAIEADAAEIAAEFTPPDVPLELPATARWLEHFAAAALDPWGVDVVG